MKYKKLSKFWLKLILVFVLSSEGVILNVLPSNAAQISPQELIRLTNEARAKNGLPSFKVSSLLTRAAENKASDMIANNYFNHFSPAGKSPWDFIKAVGYNYVYAGENLAKDFTTDSKVVDAWMESSTHRENILNSKYTDIGLATRQGKIDGRETIIAVQMFGASQSVQVVKEESIVKTAPQPQPPEQTKEIVPNTPAPQPINPSLASQNVLTESTINNNQNEKSIESADLKADRLKSQNEPKEKTLSFQDKNAKLNISKVQIKKAKISAAPKKVVFSRKNGFWSEISQVIKSDFETIMKSNPVKLHQILIKTVFLI